MAAIWAAVIGVAGSAILANQSGDKSSKYRRAAERLGMRELALYEDIWNTYKETYLPAEERLLAEAQRGLSSDYYADRAQADVASAVDRARGMGLRRLERYGVAPTSGQADQTARDFNLAEAKAVSGARTRAREWVTNTNFNRRLAALGRGDKYFQAGVSGQGKALSGLSGMYAGQAGQYDAAAGEAAAAGLGLIGTGIGAYQSSSRDAARTPLQSNSLLPAPDSGSGIYDPYDSADVRRYAEGGPVTPTAGPAPGMAGRPGMTVDLQNQYRRYNVDTQMNGEAPVDWPTYVSQQGYALDDKGLVYPATPAPAPQHFRQGGPVMAQGLRPRGRIIEGESRVVEGPEGVDRVPAMVDGVQPARLTAGEYVIPADVVARKGIEFFDRTVESARNNRRKQNQLQEAY